MREITIANAISVKLEQLVLIEQPRHHDQFYRPFVASYDTSAYNAFQDAFNSSILDRNIIAEASWRILHPSDTVCGKFDIAGGWSETRFCILMLFNVRTPHGTSYEYISAYTDYAGATRSGALDPNMRVHVNSVSSVALSSIGDGGSQYNVNKVGLTYNNGIGVTALNGSQNVGVDGLFGSSALCQAMLVNNIGSDYSYANVVSRPLTIGINDTTPHSLLSSTVTAIKRNSKAMNASMNDAIMGASLDNMPYKSGMVDGRNNLRQTMFYKLFSNGGTCRMEEITSSFPDTGQYQLMFLDSIYADVRDQGDNLGASNVVSCIGQTIANVVPPIVTACSLSVAGISVTNRTLGGELSSSLIEGSINTILPIVIDARITDRLESAISLEIDRIMHANDIQSYYIDIVCNIAGTTKITVSLDGGNLETFVCPTYCSSITSANTQVNPMQTHNIAQTLGELIETSAGF